MATIIPSSAASQSSSTATTRNANETDYQFRLAHDNDAPSFRVLRFEGDEALSELFRFRVRLGVSRREIQGSEPDTDSYLGQAAYLRIEGAAGVRHVDGHIRSFEYAGRGRTLDYYEAELVPLHWQLTERFGSRVFTEQRVRNLGLCALIDKVFTDYAGLPDDSYHKLCSDYSRGDFVAQYQETEWNFVCRMMEDLGVFYFFEHDGEGPAVMKIADDTSAYRTSPLHAELRFSPPEEHRLADEYVYELSDRRDVCSGTAVVEGYDFTQGPDYDTQAARRAERFTNLERYEYPRRLEADGQQLAQLRLDTEQCRRWVVHMKTTAHGLVPGHKFTLGGHEIDVYNREYVVVRVRQRGAHRQQSEHDDDVSDRLEDAYSAEIWAIPADERFIPRRTAHRPRIHGTQTAIVVGPDDEEIYTDRYGRVRVQFHWDREGSFGTDCSHWIRVSHGMAGGKYGMHFLPRIGQEVIVEFLEGDPDHPIITGRVYNGDHPPPYDLPEEKTKSTIKTHSYPGDDGCNELRFEDQAGEEQILLHAEKDLHVKAKGSASHSTGGTRNISTGGEHKEKVGGARHVKVEGEERVRTEGDKHSLVLGELKDYCDSDRKVTTNGACQIAARDRYSVEVTGGPLTLKAPGGFIDISEAGIVLQSAGGAHVFINSNQPEPFFPQFGACDGPTDAGGADSATPGFNVDYSSDGESDTEEERESGNGRARGGSQREDPSRYMDEIQLFNEDGTPAAGERYRISEPGREPIEGRLDENGSARHDLSKWNNPEITYPDIDGEQWRANP